LFIESAQGGDTVDATESGPAAEDEVGVFLEQNFFVERDPIGVDVELALLRTAFAETMERWTMAPIFGAFSGLMASELFQKSMPLTLS
jgi:hypothetical protein